MAVAVCVGLVVRVPRFVYSDFPLGDGALFTEMIDAIKAKDYALPDHVEYNRQRLPFAYPPLAFWLGAAISELLNVPTVRIVRFMPLVFNVLTIAIFVLVADQLVENRATVLLAALFFPLMPWSFRYVITGGGVSRSTGFFLCLMAIYGVCRLREGNRRRLWFALTAVSASAALLSHLEWGITVLVAAGLFLTIEFPQKQTGWLLVALGATAAVLTAPWWVTVVHRFGTSPFLNAGATSDWNGIRIVHQFEQFHMFTRSTYLLAWPAAIGFAAYVAGGKWYLPLWLVALFITTPRHASTPATVPLAMLAAEGVLIIEAYLTARLAGRRQRLSIGAWTIRVGLWAGLASNMAVMSFLTTVTVLTADQRAVMQWIREHTDPAAPFIVLSSAPNWADDAVSEWFPVLADRHNLLTVQGREWLPGHRFADAVVDNYVVKREGKAQIEYEMGSNGLRRYLENRFANRFRYVVIFIKDAGVTYGGFYETGTYKIIYTDPSAIILENTRYGT